jgi:hypothetical protein
MSSNVSNSVLSPRGIESTAFAVLTFAGNLGQVSQSVSQSASNQSTNQSGIWSKRQFFRATLFIAHNKNRIATKLAEIVISIFALFDSPAHFPNAALIPQIVGNNIGAFLISSFEISSSDLSQFERLVSWCVIIRLLIAPVQFIIVQKISSHFPIATNNDVKHL